MATEGGQQTAQGVSGESESIADKYFVCTVRAPRQALALAPPLRLPIPPTTPPPSSSPRISLSLSLSLSLICRNHTLLSSDEWKGKRSRRR